VQVTRHFNLKGQIFDASGQLIESAVTVQLVSTDSTSALKDSLVVGDGKFEIPNVPIGVSVKLKVVTGCGLEVSRVLTLLPPSGPCSELTSMITANFGGPATSQDPEAPVYAVPLCPTPLPTSSCGGPQLSNSHAVIWGHVYDEFGRPIADATITAVSDDASVPYDQKTTSLAANGIDERAGAYLMPVPIEPALSLTMRASSSCGNEVIRKITSKETYNDLKYGEKVPNYFSLPPCFKGGALAEIDFGTFGIQQGAFYLKGCGGSER
jgi:hypothetical protein